MQVALQATHIGGFKGAEFALEGLVVSVVRLHMSVQAGDETEHIKKRIWDKRIKDVQKTQMNWGQKDSR